MGYQTLPVVSPDATRSHQFGPSERAQMALMQFDRLSSWWGLTRHEEAALIGVSEQNLPLTLRLASPAILRRIEALLAVWSASRALDQGCSWLRCANRLCGGHSPLSVMIECAEGVDAVLGMLNDQISCQPHFE